MAKFCGWMICLVLLFGCQKKTNSPTEEKKVDPREAQRLLEKQRISKAIGVVKMTRNVNGFSMEQTLQHWRIRSLDLAKKKNLPPPSPYEWTGLCPTPDLCRISVSFFDGSVKQRLVAVWRIDKDRVKPHNDLAMILMDPRLAQPRPRPVAPPVVVPVVRTTVAANKRRKDRKRRKYRKRRKKKKQNNDDAP